MEAEGWYRAWCAAIGAMSAVSRTVAGAAQSSPNPPKHVAEPAPIGGQLPRDPSGIPIDNRMGRHVARYDRALPDECTTADCDTWSDDTPIPQIGTVFDDDGSGFRRL